MSILNITYTYIHDNFQDQIVTAWIRITLEYWSFGIECLVLLNGKEMMNQLSMDLLTRLTIIYRDKYLHRQILACLVLNDEVMTNMTIYAFQPQFFNPLKHQVGHPTFEFWKSLFPIFFILYSHNYTPPIPSEICEHIGKVIFDIPFMIQSHAESMKKILGAL